MRAVTNDERAAKGYKRLRESARCPAAWRKRAQEFDWFERAEEWDDELQRLALTDKREALRLARGYSVEAVRGLAALMRGELRGPDGELVAGQDATQRRMAMNSILDRAGVVGDVAEDEGGDEVEVIGIKVFTTEEEGVGGEIGS